ncbi:MAG: leucine-rich repeat protein [Butyrivibrio sp.]|nr:leucine-rich repeat protein [Butyrivibrio sp.]
MKRTLSKALSFILAASMAMSSITVSAFEDPDKENEIIKDQEEDATMESSEEESASDASSEESSEEEITSDDEDEPETGEEESEASDEASSEDSSDAAAESSSEELEEFTEVEKDTLAAADAAEEGFVINDKHVLTGYTGEGGEITIPDNVWEIGEAAFNGNLNIRKVTFAEGSNLTKIGKNAFSGCTELTDIVFPENLETIDDRAFYGSGLETVTLPKKLKKLGTNGINVFSRCSSLKEVTVNSTSLDVPMYFSSFDGCAIEKITFSEEMTYIPQYLFMNAGVKVDLEVTIPANVENIGIYAFHNTNIGKVLFAGNNVTEIGKAAFSGCGYLTAFDFTENLQTIGDEAFKETGLTKVTLPKKLKKLGTNGMQVFENCPIKEVTINSTSLDVCMYFPNFKGCSIEKITFSEEMTYIPRYLFMDAGVVNNLEVTIPAKVETIGNNAFQNTKIGKVIFKGNNVTLIDKEAFCGCSNITDFDFTENLQTIGDGAFKKTGLTKVTLPKKLQKLGTNGMCVFEGCPIKEVTVNSTSLDVCMYFPNFKDCAIEKITFSGEMTYIPRYLFMDAGVKTNLEVTIPASVQTIKNNAFQNTKIGKVECGAGLKTIEKNAFGGCTLLTDIYLGSKVTDINKDAFYGTIKSELTFHAPANSYAIKWAKNNGFKTDAVATHKITYVLNGGKNAAGNPATYIKGRGVSKFLAPTKKGYTFEGWFSDKNFTTEKEGIGEDETKDVTVYAKWRVNTYTVVFDKNADNATGDIASKTLKYNETFKLAKTVFKRPRYVQTSWNTKADGKGTTYKFGASVKNLTDKDGVDAVLYAVYAPCNYTIKYNVNADAVDGKITGTIKNQACKYDKAVTITTTVPKATGYVFKGWAYADDAAAPDFTAGEKLAAGDEKLENLNVTAETENSITLYGVWEAEAEYTLNVYAAPKKNVTDATEKKTFTLRYSESVDLSDLFEKDDYVIASYKNDKNKTVAAGEVKNLASKNGATVNLYADWKAVSYKVTFADSKEGTGASMKHKNKVKAITVETKTVTLLNPTKDGYKFAGWTVNAAGGEALANEGAVVTSLEKGAYHQDIVLTAQWTTRKVEYEIIVQDGDNFKDVTPNYKYYWKNTNPETFANIKDVKLKNPSMRGFTFKGWFDDAECKTKNGKLSKTAVDSTETMKKYALFTENVYKVVINGNNKKKNKRVIENVKFTQDLDPSTFAVTDEKAWTYDEGSAAQISFYSTKANGKGFILNTDEIYNALCAKNNGTVTFYAIWDTYRVNYTDADDESSTTMKNNSKNPVIFTKGKEGKSRYTTLKKPTKAGYTFKSWECEKEGAVVKLANGKFAIDRCMAEISDITVKATWTANSYKIYLYPNGAKTNLVKGDEKVPVSNSKAAGKCAVVSAAFDKNTFGYNEAELTDLNDIHYERAGYIFKEWNTKANGKGKSYVPGDAFNLTTKAKAGTTLYAIWVKVSPARVKGVKVGADKRLSFTAVKGIGASTCKYEYQKSTTLTRLSKAPKAYVEESGIEIGITGETGYVRVRAYMLDSTGAKVYGPWSFAKKYSVQ